jgi:hypothetical protein
MAVSKEIQEENCKTKETKKKQQRNASSNPLSKYAERKIAGPRVSRLFGPIAAGLAASKVQPVLIVVVGKSHQIIFGFGSSFWAFRLLSLGSW